MVCERRCLVSKRLQMQLAEKQCLSGEANVEPPGVCEVIRTAMYKELFLVLAFSCLIVLRCFGLPIANATVKVLAVLEVARLKEKVGVGLVEKMVGCFVNFQQEASLFF